MSYNKNSCLQGIASKIQYVSEQLMENDADFRDCKDALHQAVDKFGVQELALLADNLENLRSQTRQLSLSIMDVANRVRQLSE